MAEPLPWRRRTIAGWPIPAIVTTLALVALACWITWATRTLIEVRARRIVSVSLSAMVEEFVTSEARARRAPAESAVRTRVYLAAIDQAVTDLGRDGTLVLVSEATLGRSAPDRTKEVRRRVAAAMARADDER